jgi:hypothetical protein
MLNARVKLKAVGGLVWFKLGAKKCIFFQKR